jgi:hypothetical protein
VKTVKRDFGLRSVIFNNMDEVVAAESKDDDSFYLFWHPFECDPFIVHTERACDCKECLAKIKDMRAIKTLARKMDQEMNAIQTKAQKTHPSYKPEKSDYFKNHRCCVIEEAVEVLAKSMGGKFKGT